MIRVYFEDQKHLTAELFAVFEREEDYMALLPAITKLAEKSRMVVAESVVDEEEEI